MNFSASDEDDADADIDADALRRPICPCIRTSELKVQ